MAGVTAALVVITGLVGVLIAGLVGVVLLEVGVSPALPTSFLAFWGAPMAAGGLLGALAGVLLSRKVAESRREWPTE